MFLQAQEILGTKLAFFACDGCGMALDSLNTTVTVSRQIEDGPFLEVKNFHEGCEEGFEDWTREDTRYFWDNAVHGFFGLDTL
jgi:hypothetical protein